MKIKQQCSTCKFYKPFVNWRMGECFSKNKGEVKVYDQKCGDWQKGVNR